MIQGNTVQFAKDTMTKAKDVQKRYNLMGAPGTQNVRNPFPMKTLVAKRLPHLVGPDSKIRIVRSAYLTDSGKAFLQGLPNDTATAREVLPKSYWETSAISVQEMTAKLQSEGFIVKPGAVAMALSTLAHETGMVGKMSFHHYVGSISRGQWAYKRYFFVKS